MERQTIIIPEEKVKIENIKRKYKNMQMSDSAANKIISLEATNEILKLAGKAAGIITIINFIIPDPVLGLDEMALAAITGLLNMASNMVENKIDAVANSGDASLQMSEIMQLTEQMGNVATSVKSSRMNR